MEAQATPLPAIAHCLQLLKDRKFDEAQAAARSLSEPVAAEWQPAVQACVDVAAWRTAVARGRPMDEGLREAIAGTLALQQHGPGLELGWVFATIGYTLGMLGDFETGLDWLDQGADDARQRGDRMQWVLALSHKASLLAFAEEHERAFELFRQAVALCEGDAAPVRGGLVSNLAYCQILRARQCPQGDPRRLELARQALAWADEALADRTSPRHRQWHGNALENRGLALGMLGQLPEAEAVLDEALSQPDLGERVRAHLRTSQAEVLIAQGKWPQAQALLQEGTQAAHTDLVDQTLDRALELQIEVAQHFGQREEVQALWERRFRLMAERYRARLRNVRRYADLRAELTQTQAAGEQMRQQAEALRQSEARFRLLAENVSDVIWVWGAAAGRLSYMSPSVQALLGWAPEDLLQGPLDAPVAASSPARIEPVIQAAAARIAAGDVSALKSVTEVDLTHRDGHVIHAEVVTHCLLDEHGQLGSVIGVTRDVTERKRKELELRAAFERAEASARSLRDSNTRLERLATTDALTGLWNRRGFEELVAAALLAAPQTGAAMSLMLVDVDHFKPINDRFGHQAGDKVLAALAGLLRTHVRNTDTVARWGGEEFVVLMPVCDAPHAAVVAEKLRQQVAAHAFEAAGPVTASFGVAQWAPGETIDTWLRRADAALYAAKHGGRDCVRVAAVG